MSDCFDPDLTENEVRDSLSEREFKKIDEGFSAHIFGATDKSVVIKIFPPLNIGSPHDIVFIKKNSILRYAKFFTARWQKFKIIKLMRQKIKYLIAIFNKSNDSKKNNQSYEPNIRGYEICLRKGLMVNLPTRVISNCLTELNVNIGWVLKSFYEKPNKMILQKRFPKDVLLINRLNEAAKAGDISKCNKMIQDALNYQEFLWRNGVADTDMSFNIFENLIMLPDETLQLHDANDITDSKSAALWFIREKEKDISNIFMKNKKNSNTEFLNHLINSGISETANKLYGVLPSQNRAIIIFYFLNLSQKLLTEEQLSRYWASS